MLTEHNTHDLASVRSSLEDASNVVRAAQISLDAGQSVDLKGMDTRMERLCARALELPAPLAHATLPDLLALLGTVDSLIETLTNRRPR